MSEIKISIDESAYDSILKRIDDANNDVVSRIKKVESEISTLNTKEGGLQLENVSANVKKVCSKLEEINSRIEVLKVEELKLFRKFKPEIASRDKC